jgi:hypothetical protein
MGSLLGAGIIAAAVYVVYARPPWVMRTIREVGDFLEVRPRGSCESYEYKSQTEVLFTNKIKSPLMDDF